MWIKDMLFGRMVRGEPPLRVDDRRCHGRNGEIDRMLRAVNRDAPIRRPDDFLLPAIRDFVPNHRGEIEAEVPATRVVASFTEDADDVSGNALI